jgi:hypothetical protein
VLYVVDVEGPVEVLVPVATLVGKPGDVLYVVVVGVPDVVLVPNHVLVG